MCGIREDAGIFKTAQAHELFIKVVIFLAKSEVALAISSLVAVGEANWAFCSYDQAKCNWFGGQFAVRWSRKRNQEALVN